MNLKINLHGLTPFNAIRILEKELILNNLYKYDTIEIITGKSPELQKKLIKEVIEKYGFEWEIPPGNTGMIFVNENYMFI
jgi:DNA-nicking Smr family endonuclease